MTLNLENNIQQTSNEDIVLIQGADGWNYPMLRSDYQEYALSITNNPDDTSDEDEMIAVHVHVLADGNSYLIDYNGTLYDITTHDIVGHHCEVTNTLIPIINREDTNIDISGNGVDEPVGLPLDGGDSAINTQTDTPVIDPIIDPIEEEAAAIVDGEYGEYSDIDYEADKSVIRTEWKRIKMLDEIGILKKILGEKTGMSASEIKKNIDETTLDYESEEKCAVCLLPFENSDNFTTTICGHSFHPECIDTCVNTHRNHSCPVCRHDFSY
jgi:hypothetical protein